MIICVDFDGTLVSEDYPDIGKPNYFVINRLLGMKKNEGAKLILWTCRTGKHLEEAIETCKEWGLEFDAVNRNIDEVAENWGGHENCGPKPFANIYLDDHVVNVRDLRETFLFKKRVNY